MECHCVNFRFQFYWVFEIKSFIKVKNRIEDLLSDFIEFIIKIKVDDKFLETFLKMEQTMSWNTLENGTHSTTISWFLKAHVSLSTTFLERKTWRELLEVWESFWTYVNDSVWTFCIKLMTTINLPQSIVPELIYFLLNLKIAYFLHSSSSCRCYVRTFFLFCLEFHREFFFRQENNNMQRFLFLFDFFTDAKLNFFTH